MNTDYSAYVPDVIFEKIPIKNLVSCQDYQRSLSESQILKIVREFDLYQINLVKVSRRDGTNFVFDGQHTIEAVALKSGSRDTPVWCMIFDHLSYEHEAHIFAEQQKHHRPVSPYDTFYAHLESGSEKHLLIRDLVYSYNLELGSTQKRHGVICAIAALENIFDTYGYHVLDKVLRILVSTSPRTALVLSVGEHTVSRLVGAAMTAILAGEGLVRADGLNHARAAAGPVVALDETNAVGADLLLGDIILIAAGAVVLVMCRILLGLAGAQAFRAFIHYRPVPIGLTEHLLAESHEVLVGVRSIDSLRHSITSKGKGGGYSPSP